jgi:MoaA/NifB/PqqE/SkfB family radical SAM enzyme
MTKEKFAEIVATYPGAIIHVTGGEPSTVPWLYDFIENTEATFHLNTNAYILPPKNVKRLKVSLDTMIPKDFDDLVKLPGAFDRVVDNIQEVSKETVTSITCLLNKQTYTHTPVFMRWFRHTFPDVYAVFFSVYKGDNPLFKFSDREAEHFFRFVRPKLEKEMDPESLALLSETLDHKKRIIQGTRFTENAAGLCYLSMSERIYDWKGGPYHCSHLYRDGVKHLDFEKKPQCLYGCNHRLVMFNQEVERRLDEHNRDTEGNS